MAMATVIPAESVQEGAIIVVPLTIPRPDDQRILNKEKNKNGINEKETQLSIQNSKSVD